MEFIKALFKNVPVLDAGARGATTTFYERGIGDVLIAWENEAYLALAETGKDKVEIVNPSVSILAEPPVAVVEKVAAARGTSEIAKAYLEFLYTPEGQEIAAKTSLSAATERCGRRSTPINFRLWNFSLLTKWPAAGAKRKASTSTTAACSTRSTNPVSNRWAGSVTTSYRGSGSPLALR